MHRAHELELPLWRSVCLAWWLSEGLWTPSEKCMVDFLVTWAKHEPKTSENRNSNGIRSDPHSILTA